MRQTNLDLYEKASPPTTTLTITRYSDKKEQVQLPALFFCAAGDAPAGEGTWKKKKAPPKVTGGANTWYAERLGGPESEVPGFHVLFGAVWVSPQSG
jgi:hypothetical protein